MKRVVGIKPTQKLLDFFIVVGESKLIIRCKLFRVVILCGLKILNKNEKH